MRVVAGGQTLRIWTGAFTATFEHASSASNRKITARAKAVLKSPQSRPKRVGARPANLAQRLECGAFTAAFARTRGEGVPRKSWPGRTIQPHPGPLHKEKEKRLPRPGKLATPDSYRYKGSMREFFRGNLSPREKAGVGGNDAWLIKRVR